MARVIALNCPGCQAPLPVRPDQASVRCEYCGREAMVKHTHHHQPPVLELRGADMAQVGLQQIQVQVRRTGRRAAWWAILPATIAMVGGISLAGFLSYRGHRATVSAVATPTRFAPDRGGPGSAGGSTSAPERGSWQEIGGGVLPARINQDDVEDFLIRFQRDGDERPLFVVAVDGRSFERLWTAGPFGEGSDGSIHSRVAASQKHVVVTDPSSRAHVLELATGRETAAVDMSDRADRLCMKPDGTEAWIQVVDRKHLAVTLATGEVRPQQKIPGYCASVAATRWMIRCIHHGSPAHRLGHSRARCTDLPRKWRIDGFGNAYALKSENGHVAVGSKSPGTAFPIIVGVDERGKVRWRRGLADGDRHADSVVKETPALVDIARGAVVIAHKKPADRWRLMALEEATGTILWRHDLAEESHWGQGMTLSDDRVYLLISPSILVHDLATGKQLAVLKSR